MTITVWPQVRWQGTAAIAQDLPLDLQVGALESKTGLLWGFEISKPDPMETSLTKLHHLILLK